MFKSCCKVISIQGLLDELTSFNLISKQAAPIVHCKAFEDNAGAVELATAPKIRPRTKHINCECHCFREAVHDKRITIQCIATEEQLADAFTKPLGEQLFHDHRVKINGY